MIKYPPKIVQLPPRPGKHPHLVDHPGEYLKDDRSGEKQEGSPPVRLRQRSKRQGGAGQQQQQQMFATWEPCARAVETERKDFWEFILCNLAFASVALFIVVIRGRIIAARHYNKLVNLVGLTPLQQLFQKPGGSTANGATNV